MLAFFMRQSGKLEDAVLLDAQLTHNSILVEQLGALKFQAVRSPNVPPTDFFAHGLPIYMKFDHTLDISHCG